MGFRFRLTSGAGALGATNAELREPSSMYTEPYAGGAGVESCSTGADAPAEMPPAAAIWKQTVFLTCRMLLLHECCG